MSTIVSPVQRRRVRISRRSPVDFRHTTATELVLLTIIVALLVTQYVTMQMLLSINNAQKAQPVAAVCFGYDGRPLDAWASELGQECRKVAIRELPRRF